MRSTSEEQTSINLAELDEAECKLPVGKEIENSQDTFQFLLRSAQKPWNKISPSIRMIPRRIRDLKAKIFEPRQVSIGPLHRNNVNLQAFERQKTIFLHDLLGHKSLQLKQTLETCVQKVNVSIVDIKACYDAEIFKFYKDDEITKMMVMDGCFILEFIYKLFKSNFDDEMDMESISMAFDLVLIENQIPFFVLQHIFECTSSRFNGVTSLHDLIIHGLIPFLGLFDLQYRIKKNKVFNGIDHILGFVHECYRKPSGDTKKQGSSDSVKNHILGFIDECYRPLCDAVKKVVEKYQSPNTGDDADKNPLSEYDYFVIRMSSVPFHPAARIYSAVELDRAGVNFKPHHQLLDGKWSMDIELKVPFCSWCRPWAKPTLRMPLMLIHNNTELVFRNLIAYEQLSTRAVSHYITSYAKAMDRLVENNEDVAILVKSKVLINTIGSNEEATKLINDMCKGISCICFFYNEQWKGMENYRNKFWPRNIAWLRHTYFSNPWNIIALLAGMLLFGFTLVQTYYTVNPV